MNCHSIEVFGVTPVEHFPKCPPQHPCTQFCEIDKLSIPSSAIHFESLRQISFKICIQSFNVICTPAGKKLVIHGIKKIKLFSINDNYSQCIQSIDFDIPFCTFILLKEHQDDVVDICSVVEDLTVKFYDCKCLMITSVIFVCPVFKKGQQLSPSQIENTVNDQSKHSFHTHCHTQEHHHCPVQKVCDHPSPSQPNPPLCKKCQTTIKQ